MSQSTKAQQEPQKSDEHTVEVEQQMVFNGAGDLEPDSESVETSLEAFGADVDHRKRPTRVAEPAASEFGIDDRTKVTGTNEGDQSSLFTDVKNDQQTLEGKDASNQCLFNSEADSDVSDPEEGQ